MEISGFTVEFSTLRTYCQSGIKLSIKMFLSIIRVCSYRHNPLRSAVHYPLIRNAFTKVNSIRSEDSLRFSAQSHNQPILTRKHSKSLIPLQLANTLPYSLQPKCFLSKWNLNGVKYLFLNSGKSFLEISKYSFHCQRWCKAIMLIQIEVQIKDNFLPTKLIIVPIYV